MSSQLTSLPPNLNGAVLNRDNLSGANLRGAKLSNTDLGGADLTGANLSGIKKEPRPIHPRTRKTRPPFARRFLPIPSPKG